MPMTDQPDLFGNVVDLAARRAQRENDDVPVMIDRVQVEVAQHGQSYEEANWAKLSPAFRRAHNRLRQMRGLAPIGEPKVDLYVPSAVRKAEKFDPTSPEAIAAARQFLHGARMMIPGSEGFEDRGTNAASWQDP
jgi:hypothetical protein